MIVELYNIRDRENYGYGYRSFICELDAAEEKIVAPLKSSNKLKINNNYMILSKSNKLNLNELVLFDSTPPEELEMAFFRLEAFEYDIKTQNLTLYGSSI